MDPGFAKGADHGERAARHGPAITGVWGRFQLVDPLVVDRELPWC